MTMKCLCRHMPGKCRVSVPIQQREGTNEILKHPRILPHNDRLVAVVGSSNLGITAVIISTDADAKVIVQCHAGFHELFEPVACRHFLDTLRRCGRRIDCDITRSIKRGFTARISRKTEYTRRT